MDPLLSVLAVILRESEGSECEVAKREELISIRSAAYCIRFILSERAAELDPESTTRYPTIILDTVEDAVEVDVCDQVLDCAQGKTCAFLFQEEYKETYPKSHALCHSAIFSFPDPAARGHLHQILTQSLIKLLSLPGKDKPLILPARKPRREPQWEMSTSAGQVFRTISQCRHRLEDCDIIEHLETHLALATHLDISDEDEHFVDLLFALDTERPRCDEVRIHAHRPGPKVMFVDERSKRQTPMKTIGKVPHFCELLAVPKARRNAACRVNVTVGTDNAMWLHRPTPRVLKQADLCHSVSLAAILASDKRKPSDMAKLVLAVILSYSLFYLFEGPWLGPRHGAEWSQKNIIFFKKGGKLPLRPFLRSDIRGNNSRASDGGGHGVDREDSPCEYPALLCFGITLLEIHLGATIESFLNLPEPLTSLDDKYARACEVFEKRKEYIRGEYREAIQACLDTQFGDENTDWYEDGNKDELGVRKAVEEVNVEHLRRMIFEEIVRPLHDDLENSFGKVMEFKDDLDKQAASMDFYSSLSVAGAEVETPIKYHGPDENLTHEKPFANLERSRVSSRGAGDGNLHAPSGDLSPQLSLQEHGPTDDWFKRFRGLEALFPVRQLQPGDSRRVRVAIIDTGTDMGHIDMQAAAANGQISKICDWVDGRDGVEDWNIGDSEGHGTHITSVILDMAPHVNLYIARVTKRRQLSDGEAENVAKAIRTAVLNWGCDIVSLSLGFTRGIPCIQSELESAINAGALVFAAASNDGANSGLAYPAWHSRVFCIYSSDGHGNRAPYNPSTDDQSDSHGGADRFSIVGQYVRGAWPSKSSTQGVNDHVRRLCGTSCATPVAAGLAACVLGFARLAREPEKFKTESFYKLASYDGMRRVLRKMTRLRDGYQYLNPFKFFDRERCEIEADIRKALNPEK